MDSTNFILLTCSHSKNIDSCILNGCPSKVLVGEALNEYGIMNPKNKPITKSIIQSIFQQIGISYEIKDLSLFQRAFVHKSYSSYSLRKKCVSVVKFTKRNLYLKYVHSFTFPSTNYEMLELYGDSVLRLCLVDILIEKFPNYNEGVISSMRMNLEKGTTLYKLAEKMDLGRIVHICPVLELKHYRSSPEILEDLFESFLGAIFLDSNKDYSLCKKIINICFHKFILFNSIIYAKNYKNIIIAYFRKHNLGRPQFRLTNDLNTITKTVLLKDTDDRVISTGSGKTQKEAEQDASYKALIKFGVIQEKIDEQEQVQKEEIISDDSESDVYDEI